MAEQSKGNEEVDTPVIKRYVLILNTGGTIGMQEAQDDGGLVPGPPGSLENLVKTDPWLNDPDYTVTKLDKARVDLEDGTKRKPLAMKKTEDGYRIVYAILDFDPLLDSSNMNADGWTKMVDYIGQYYQRFDGFVILHGTDTMAYSSSVLPFMLEGLGKGVVLTGSQVPLFQLRTDAEQNLKGALIMAGRYCYDIPEVTLFFHNTLFRGCRAVKANASSFAAFASPNMKPLASIGVNITVKEKYIFKQTSRLTIYKKISPDIGSIRLFPGISAKAVTDFLKPLKGAVLETFGAGNAPSDIVDALRKATAGTSSDHRVLIVNVSQCFIGTVEDIYATGNQLIEAGVVPGADMTPEAALAKIGFLLEQSDLSYEQKQANLQVSLRGELTPSSAPPLVFSDEKPGK